MRRSSSTMKTSWSRASSIDNMTRELMEAEEGCRHRDHSSSTSSHTRSSDDSGSEWTEKITYAADTSFEPLVNFGVVAPGLYRSGYPGPQHFAYMSNLRLKTIVTLVANEEPDEALESFVSDSNIKQVFFAIKGTKKEAIPDVVMSDILGIVLNSKNHPLLIHCNKGKHRTGCVVAAVRKTHGWHSSRALAEYRSFAEPKVRETDVEYITQFDHVAMGIAVPAPFTDHVMGGHSKQMNSRTRLPIMVPPLSQWACGPPISAYRHPETHEVLDPSASSGILRANAWHVAILSAATVCVMVWWFIHAL